MTEPDTAAGPAEPRGTSDRRGHLFVVKADLIGLSCDALLVPTDDDFQIESWCSHLVGLNGRRTLDAAAWSDGELVRAWPELPDVISADAGPVVFIGRVATSRRSRGALDPVAHAAEVAEAFVEQAAELFTAQPEGADRRFKVALNLLGTGRGGLANNKGELLRPLVSRLMKVAARTGVDVVLTVVDDLAWSAVQAVRRSFEPADAWQLGVEHLALAERLADHARGNRLVLFIGAGVSQDAGLPGWKALLEAVARAKQMSEAEIEVIAEMDARDRARLIERRFDDRKEFVDAVRESLAGTRFGLTHALLASLGVEAAVTTNFDQLFEAACTLPRNDASKPKVLPYEVADDERSWVLKLHGDLEQGDVVITRSDYFGMARERGALIGIVQALLVTRHLLFVGYSMSDEDFHELVNEIDAALGSDTRTHLGTALVLTDSPWGELWSEAVDIERIGGESLTENSWAMQMILDRVNCLATDQAAHLLDPRFRGLLDPAEQEVAEGLEEIARMVRHLPADSSTRASLENLLRTVGSSSAPSAT